MYDDFERRLTAAPNVGVVVGFVLFCVSLFALIVCCCCFRGNNQEDLLPAGKARDLDLVETDSSGSESSKDDAAIALFLKGRQAAMAEGFRDEPMDAYAVGYVDGAHYSEQQKESLSDAQVLKQAKKLGYAGVSADAYVQGFQHGVRNGVNFQLSDQEDAYEAGLLNAEARGLNGRDREAYARGYSAGDASGERFDNDEDLILLAQSEGFRGPHTDLYAAGYNDGVAGMNVTDMLSPSAAFQKGLANAAALGLSEDDAVAHASGFQEEYATAIIGDGTETFSEADIVVKAAEAGFTGAAAKHFCCGFEEGVDEGTAARTRVFMKGVERGEGLEMTGNTTTAFATGYKDGCTNSAMGYSLPSDEILKATAISKDFPNEKEITAYIRGVKEGQKSASFNGKSARDILLPEAVLEKAFFEAQGRNNDNEASAAYASGCHDGYCFGLTGGKTKSDNELTEMAEKLGFEGYDVDLYCSGFKDGLIEGNDARGVVYQKGLRKASGLGLSGDAAIAYANGYCDGNTVVISGEEEETLSKSAVKKQAKKLGYSRQLCPFYVNGFQDGQRDGFESVASGHALLKGAAYAKGLLDGKSQGMVGDTGHAYATGYSEGYERARNGGAAVSEDDLRASALEHAFDNKKAEKAFIKGFDDGFDDGLGARKQQIERILSPTAALERGAANAAVLNLKGEAGKAYSDGFADGYSVGLAGYQCPRDSKLMENASDLGFSADSRLSYLNGFKEGHKEGAVGSVNKNVVGLTADAAYTKGLEKADIHGMKGITSKAYATGYKDGYAAGLGSARVEGAENEGAGNGVRGAGDAGTGTGNDASGTGSGDAGGEGAHHELVDQTELSRKELTQKAHARGYSDKRHIHAYISGYLAGEANGSAVVHHHSLCDVHRCTSSYCETCRNMKSPKFLHIPAGYKHNDKKWVDKLWWKGNNNKDEDMEIV